MTSDGRKDDVGKPRYDLVPTRALRALVDGLTYGAVKYGDWNWARVSNGRGRYTAALYRHLEAWRGGEANDPETGLPHLAHALANLVFLFEVDHGPN